MSPSFVNNRTNFRLQKYKQLFLFSLKKVENYDELNLYYDSKMFTLV